MADVPLAVKPGTRLAGRYRLLDRHLVGDPASRATGTVAGMVSWRAHDEMLNRTVHVRVLPADAPRAAAVLDAARRAAAVGDPRFLAVLDVDVSGGLAYVVGEDVAAESLADLLRRSPLGPVESRWLGAEVARALGHAHAAGLAHRCLVPEAVLLTEEGRVKVAGLAVDAAARGGSPYVDDDAVATDLRACGGLLYAMLTGRWPAPPAVAGLPDGPPASGLPSAPRVLAADRSPRQVRAAVPSDLDEVTRRALGSGHRRDAGPVLAGPADLADALVGPEHAHREAGTGPLPAVHANGDDVPLLAAPAAGTAASRLGLTVVVLLVAAGLGLLGWQVMLAAAAPQRSTPSGPPATAAAAPRVTPTAAGVPTGQLVPVRGVVDSDPEGNGEENPGLVTLAVDSDPTTAWTTLEYYNRPFGGLKAGVGLVLDLGAPAPVSTLTVGLLGRGSDVELRVPADGPVVRPPAALGDYEVLDRATGAGSLVTLRAPEQVQTRYLLVWFTALPSAGVDVYRGGISRVEVRS